MAIHNCAGHAGEALAEAYLKQQGLSIIARNVRCRQGEIDLVMRDGKDVVFVEVRYRRSTRFGLPLETIDGRKQARLWATAQYYLQTAPRLAAQPCRFDAVGLTGPLTDIQVNWIKNAFSAPE